MIPNMKTNQLIYWQLYIIRPADLEEVTFLLPYTSVAECRAATSIISMGYAHAPHYVWGNRNRISPRCCPTIDRALTINMGQKVYYCQSITTIQVVRTLQHRIF